jgi:hypothetical protein
MHGRAWSTADGHQRNSLTITTHPKQTGQSGYCGLFASYSAPFEAR